MRSQDRALHYSASRGKITVYQGSGLSSGGKAFSYTVVTASLEQARTRHSRFTWTFLDGN